MRVAANDSQDAGQADGANRSGFDSWPAPPCGGGRRIQARKRDHGARPAGEHARKFRASLPGFV